MNDSKNIPPHVMAMGKRIHDARKALGLTQKDMAEATGMPKRTYETYERAEIASPSHDKLQDIASALGKSVDDLLPNQSSSHAVEKDPVVYKIPLKDSPGLGDQRGGSGVASSPAGRGRQPAGHPAIVFRGPGGRVLYSVTIVAHPGSTLEINIEMSEAGEQADYQDVNDSVDASNSPAAEKE